MNNCFYKLNVIGVRRVAKDMYCIKFILKFNISFEDLIIWRKNCLSWCYLVLNMSERKFFYIIYLKVLK